MLYKVWERTKHILLPGEISEVYLRYCIVSQNYNIILCRDDKYYEQEEVEKREKGQG